MFAIFCYVACYIAKNRLYTTAIAKKGGHDISERRWYVAKEVNSLIGVCHIPEPGRLGQAGGQGPQAPAAPASLSLSLGLDWIVTSQMQQLDWLQARLRAYWQAAALYVGRYVAPCQDCLD